MATDMVLDFYESINFELIDIDGYDTLFTELLEDGTYATVSDDDGYRKKRWPFRSSLFLYWLANCLLSFHKLILCTSI